MNAIIVARCKLLRQGDRSSLLYSAAVALLRMVLSVVLAVLPFIAVLANPPPRGSSNYSCNPSSSRQLVHLAVLVGSRGE